MGAPGNLRNPKVTTMLLTILQDLREGKFQLQAVKTVLAFEALNHPFRPVLVEIIGTAYEEKQVDLETLKSELSAQHPEFYGHVLAHVTSAPRPKSGGETSAPLTAAAEAKPKKAPNANSMVSRAGGSRRTTKRPRCNICHHYGHLAAACPACSCSRCHANDHWAWDCTVGRRCNACGVPGHLGRFCPSNSLRASERHGDTRVPSVRGSQEESKRNEVSRSPTKTDLFDHNGVRLATLDDSKMKTPSTGALDGSERGGEPKIRGWLDEGAFPGIFCEENEESHDLCKPAVPSPPVKIDIQNAKLRPAEPLSMSDRQVRKTIKDLDEWEEYEPLVMAEKYDVVMSPVRAMAAGTTKGAKRAAGFGSIDTATPTKSSASFHDRRHKAAWVSAPGVATTSKGSKASISFGLEPVRAEESESPIKQNASSGGLSLETNRQKQDVKRATGGENTPGVKENVPHSSDRNSDNGFPQPSSQRPTRRHDAGVAPAAAHGWGSIQESKAETEQHPSDVQAEDLSAPTWAGVALAAPKPAEETTIPTTLKLKRGGKKGRRAEFDLTPLLRY